MIAYLEVYQIERQLCEEEGAESDSKKVVLNRRIIAIQKTIIQCLRVGSQEDALSQFVRSRRVQDDLATAISDFESGRPQVYDLYIREYAEFPIEAELRGFVYDRKLTALTAYHDHLYVPFIDENADEIREKAGEFVSDVVIPALCGHLPGAASERFCLDIAYRKNLDGTYKFWCVELNCFAEIAGTCKFTWHNDKAVLMGLDPFEFRYNSKIPKFDPFFASSHTRWMDDLLVKYGYPSYAEIIAKANPYKRTPQQLMDDLFELADMDKSSTLSLVETDRVACAFASLGFGSSSEHCFTPPYYKLAEALGIETTAQGGTFNHYLDQDVVVEYWLAHAPELQPDGTYSEKVIDVILGAGKLASDIDWTPTPEDSAMAGL